MCLKLSASQIIKQHLNNGRIIHFYDFLPNRQSSNHAHLSQLLVRYEEMWKSAGFESLSFFIQLLLSLFLCTNECNTIKSLGGETVKYSIWSHHPHLQDTSEKTVCVSRTELVDYRGLVTNTGCNNTGQGWIQPPITISCKSLQSKMLYIHDCDKSVWLIDWKHVMYIIWGQTSPITLKSILLRTGSQWGCLQI